MVFLGGADKGGSDRCDCDAMTSIPVLDTSCSIMEGCIDTDLFLQKKKLYSYKRHEKVWYGVRGYGVSHMTVIHLMLFMQLCVRKIIVRKHI